MAHLLDIAIVNIIIDILICSTATKSSTCRLYIMLSRVCTSLAPLAAATVRCPSAPPAAGRGTSSLALKAPGGCLLARCGGDQYISLLALAELYYSNK